MFCCGLRGLRSAYEVGMLCLLVVHGRLWHQQAKPARATCWRNSESFSRVPTLLKRTDKVRDVHLVAVRDCLSPQAGLGGVRS